MNADTVAVKHLFEGGRRYLVPLFQRPYVWNRKEQWQPLWEDVERLANGVLKDSTPTAHFLGAIVLEQIPQPTGRLELRQVIDGQQRLTTLQLLLEAFRDVTGEKGLPQWNGSVGTLTRNQSFLTHDPVDAYKIWPTNADRAAWQQVLDSSGPPELLAAVGKSSTSKHADHPIADAYLFFYRRISDWLGNDEDTDSRAGALFGAVRDLLRVVVIDLSQDDDSQLIFETLNARGTPLLASDLIKNFLFRRVDGDQDLSMLYAGTWSSFDEHGGYWRKPIGRGHARRPRIDTFLQFYLTRQAVEEIPVAHLYTAYRGYVRERKLEDIPAELERIQRNAAVYRLLDTKDLTGRARLFMDRLEAMNVTSAYPFLLELFDRHMSNEEELETTLTYLESFLVRRMVGRLTTRSYGRLFVDLLSEIRENDSPSSAVRSYLAAADSEVRRWPSDVEFRKAWLEVPVYKRLSKNRIQMLLEAVEDQMRSRQSEPVSFGNGLTIEHLMPQSWAAHYTLPDGKPAAIAELERNQIIHTMGNLTLVTQPLNSSLSHGPWEQKREKILEHSALALNRVFQYQTEWNEQDIQARGERLFEAARKTWPVPELTHS